MVTRFIVTETKILGYEIGTRFIVTETKIFGYEIGTRTRF